MELLLINPSRGINYRAHSDFRISSQVRDKKYYAMPLALTVVAGLTPSDVNIRIIDEEIEDIDFDTHADIVGLTAMTYKVKRAYQIADEFRKRGCYVVLGGIHASMLPDESLEHVDTVVIGEAEPVWQELIDDFKNNKIQRVYRSATYVDLNDIPLPRRDLIKNDVYMFYMMQTTRGCPFQCKFCSVQKFNGRKVRLAGMEKVRKEIENIIEISKSQTNKSMPKIRDGNGRIYDGFINIFVTDDNFTINRQHAIEVCQVLNELSDKHNVKLLWITHADIGVSEDEELLKILSNAGCRRLFIGFESLEDANLKLINKHCKKSENYSDSIRKIYSYGIDIIASFVIGNDYDSTESLYKLVDFAKDNCLFNILVSILTPYPGTELYFEFEKENRITSKNWDYYDFGKVVYKPIGLLAEDLLRFQNDLFTKFFDIQTMKDILIKRDKELLADVDKLTFEPPINKYQFMSMIVKKIFKILMDSGMHPKDILPITSYVVDYAYNAEEVEHISLKVIGGVLNFIDKAHYIYWKKNYDNVL
jgi:radical SAM superfamily enzyme YgiQ (UPF0313 family)